MSYHIYQTKGWVLGGHNTGEANRSVHIFTRELGLVRAHAQSVRKLASKLKFGLQDYSYSNVSLIKGKESWKLVGAEKIDGCFDKLGKQKGTILCRIFSLLSRLINGEEADVVLFDDLSGAVDFLATVKDDVLLANLEVVLVLRILRHLGYVGADPALLPFIEFAEWQEGVLDMNKETRRLALQNINRSLAESGL